MSEKDDLTQKEQELSNSLRRFKAGIFQALAHPTRVAIVDILRNGPLSAGEILSKLDVEQPNISQHLSVLRGRQIVEGRKRGNQVFYALRDPVLIEVLNLLRIYFFSHLAEAQVLLGMLGREGRPSRTRGRGKSLSKEQS